MKEWEKRQAVDTVNMNGDTRSRIIRFFIGISIGLLFGSYWEPMAAGMENGLPLEEVAIPKLGMCGRMPASDTRIAAKIELLFMQKRGKGIIPLLSRNIEVKPEYYTVKGRSLEEIDAMRKKRKHEAYVGLSMDGIDNRNGCVGVSFNVVPVDYTGKGWDVLIAGNSYRIRMQSPLVSEVWLHVPHDIVPGKTYVARWLVEPKDKKEDGGVSKLLPPTIQCTVVPSLLSEGTGQISAVYRNLKAGIETEKIVEASGMFSIRGSLQEGDLTLYTGRGNSAAAMCTVSGTAKRQIVLPDDATEVYPGSDFVSGEVRVEKGLRITKKSLFVAVYASENSQIPLCFRFLDSKEFLSKRLTGADCEEAVVMSFAFLPGEYEARIYQYGGEIGSHSSTSNSISGRELLARMSVRLTDKKIKGEL